MKTHLDHFHHRVFKHDGGPTDLKVSPYLEEAAGRILRYGSPISWMLKPIIDLYGITEPGAVSDTMATPIETIWLQLVTRREGSYLMGAVGFMRPEDEALYRNWLARRQAVDAFLAETA